MTVARYIYISENIHHAMSHFAGLAAGLIIELTDAAFHTIDIIINTSPNILS